MQGIKEKFLYQFLFALSQLAFPLITYPYITRRLGPESLGKVAYVEYVVGLLITFSAIGIPVYATRKIAQLRDNKPDLLKTLNELVLIHLFTSVLSLVVFFIFFYLNNWAAKEINLVLLGGFSILLNALMVDWFLQGIEAFKYIAVRTIYLRLAGAVLVFLFVQHTGDYNKYFLISIMVQLAVTILNHRYILRYLKGERFTSPLQLKSHYRPLISFFLTSSLTGVYVFFDTVLLGLLTDDLSVGYYTAAIKILKLALLVILTLNGVLFPQMSYLANKKNYTRIQSLLDASLRFIFFLGLPAFVFFYFLSDELVRVITGKDFLPAASAMKLMAILPLVWGLNNTLIYQVLVPFQKEKKLVLIMLLASAISIMGNYLLIRQFGYNGTATSTLLTEVFILIVLLVISQRTTPIAFSPTVVAGSMVSAILIIPFLFLVKYITREPALVLLSGIGIGGAIYLSCQYFIFKDKIMNIMICYAIKLIKYKN